MNKLAHLNDDQCEELLGLADAWVELEEDDLKDCLPENLTPEDHRMTAAHRELLIIAMHPD